MNAFVLSPCFRGVRESTVIDLVNWLQVRQADKVADASDPAQRGRPIKASSREHGPGVHLARNLSRRVCPHGGISGTVRRSLIKIVADGASHRA